MRLIYVIIISVFVLMNIEAQDTIPAEDTTRWTDFRDYYFNPNMTVIKNRLNDDFNNITGNRSDIDSILSVLIIYLDSAIAAKTIIFQNGFKFQNDTMIIDTTRFIEDYVFDTIRFKDGTKQSTAFSP